VASKRNSPEGDAAEKLLRIPRYHEFKNSPKEDPKILPRDPNRQDVKSPRAPLRDPKVQEIHVVQELPREIHIVRSQAFPRNRIYLYCRRPTVGVDEPSIIKANLVQACNQKKGPSRIVENIMKVSVTCQFTALILHHYRNSPW